MNKTIEDQVVAMYQAGVKTAFIEQETGVKRPTIYYLLEKRGIRPSRTGRPAAVVDVGQVLERLAASEREVGRLTERLSRYEAGWR
jgi:hypothetical protein